MPASGWDGDPDGAHVLPLTAVCPSVSGPAEDAVFTACPAHDLTMSVQLLDLWHACGGRIEALLSIVPSASAALVDAWGILAAEMDRLNHEIRRRAT